MPPFGESLAGSGLTILFQIPLKNGADLALRTERLEQPRTKDFLQTAYNELKHIIETVKVVVPENLKGVMEADEFELVMHLFCVIHQN